MFNLLTLQPAEVVAQSSCSTAIGLPDMEEDSLITTSHTLHHAVSWFKVKAVNSSIDLYLEGDAFFTKAGLYKGNCGDLVLVDEVNHPFLETNLYFWEAESDSTYFLSLERETSDSIDVNINYQPLVTCKIKVDFTYSCLQDTTSVRDGGFIDVCIGETVYFRPWLDWGHCSEDTLLWVIDFGGAIPGQSFWGTNHPDEFLNFIMPDVSNCFPMSVEVFGIDGLGDTVCYCLLPKITICPIEDCSPSVALEQSGCNSDTVCLTYVSKCTNTEDVLIYWGTGDVTYLDCSQGCDTTICYVYQIAGDFNIEIVEIVLIQSIPVSYYDTFVRQIPVSVFDAPGAFTVTGPNNVCDDTSVYQISFIDPNDELVITVNGGTVLDPDPDNFTIVWTNWEGGYIALYNGDTLCPVYDTFYVKFCCGIDKDSVLLVSDMPISGLFTTSAGQLRCSDPAFSNAGYNSIFINGTLTVDQDFRFSQCPRIRFGPDASIEVVNGNTLTLDTSILWHGCDTMWQGINIWGNTSFAKLNTSEVRDAFRAVRSVNGGVYEIDKSSVLRNNEVHIKVENYQNQGAHQGFVRNTTLYHDSVFKSPCPCLSKTTYRSVWVENVDYISIGDGSEEEYLNTFRGFSDAGIYVKNYRDLFINNNYLSNHGYSSSPAHAFYVANGDGIYADGLLKYSSITVGGAGFLANEFGHATQNPLMSKGVYSFKGGYASVSGNSFRRVSQAIRLEDHSTSLGSFYVNSNYIQLGTRGVYILNSTGPAEVSSNTILMNINSSFINYGISRENPALHSSNSTLVSQNLISNSRRAIELTNQGQLEVSENLISYPDNMTQSGLAYGIRLNFCESPLVRENIVSSVASTPEKFVGIALDNNNQSFLCSNEVYDLGRGIWYNQENRGWDGSGFSIPVEIKLNKMENCDIGFLMSNEAEIGPQGSDTESWDNEWHGTFTWATYTEDSNDNPNDNPWYVQSGSPFNPSPNGSDPIDQDLYFLQPNFYDSFDCPAGTQKTGGTGGFGVPSSLTTSGSYGNDFEGSANWVADFARLNRLKQAGATTAGTAASFLTTLAGRSNDKLAEVEGLIATSAQPNGTYDRNLLAQARNLNAQVTDTLEVALHLKDANELLLRSLLTGQWDFSASELRQLEETAALCPFIYGQAVYRARALLNSIGLDRFFEDTDCNWQKNIPETANRMGNPADGFGLYPNPAQTSLTLQLFNEPENPIQVTISNVAGRVLYKETFFEAGNQFTIQLPPLENGLYFVQVFEGSVPAGTRKLMILK